MSRTLLERTSSDEHLLAEITDSDEGRQKNNGNMLSYQYDLGILDLYSYLEEYGLMTGDGEDSARYRNRITNPINNVDIVVFAKTGE